MKEHYRIGIDGPSGAGKSTVAKAVAARLGIRYLDTGAMYRALALYAARRGVSCQDEAGVAAILPEADVAVRYTDEGQRTLLNGEDVTEGLRTPALSMGASDISAHPCVRDHMTLLQRRVADIYAIVMDGRDITTNVLRDTPYKIYLTATPEERAARRFEELRAKGDESVTLDEVLQDIRTRDHNDSTRAYMPLQLAPDAALIDTTHMSIEEATEAVLACIEERGRA